VSERASERARERGGGSQEDVVESLFFKSAENGTHAGHASLSRSGEGDRGVSRSGEGGGLSRGHVRKASTQQQVSSLRPHTLVA
jgi:hypothetical protein